MPVICPIITSMVVSIKMGPDRGQAGIIANTYRDLHRIGDSTQIGAFSQDAKFVAQTSDQLDFRLQSDAIDDSDKGVRPVLVPPERANGNGSDERSDLNFDRFRVRVNFIESRAAQN
jgi:hypothetical protein